MEDSLHLPPLRKLEALCALSCEANVRESEQKWVKKGEINGSCFDISEKIFVWALMLFTVLYQQLKTSKPSFAPKFKMVLLNE